MLGGPTHSGPLRGEVRVPGDKSISHRAAIAAARCERSVDIHNLNPGRDVEATIAALAALGVRIAPAGTSLNVEAMPLRPPESVVDCMNSGSTARMLLGVCAGASIPARFDGDRSLRRRPMEPVAAQLRAFGARIETTRGGLPAALLDRPAVETRHFILLAPSAQVKSALLFAAAFAGVPIEISGDRGSRDHTERLLRFLGAGVRWDGKHIEFTPAPLRASALSVPGDLSAAAFFITGAAIVPGSALLVRDVGVNPTRTGLLEVLELMGAQIELRNRRDLCGEPVADVAVEHAPLHGADIGSDLALRAIDEIPLLAIAAAFATGQTRVAGIGSLRSKESDRIAAIERLLESVGIGVALRGNELTIAGGRPMAVPGARIETHGDHRVAMAASILSRAAGPIAMDDAESPGVSFPGFNGALESLRG
jgi:3-phosphoshikimate 1-carboxyvinyltransferase